MCAITACVSSRLLKRSSSGSLVHCFDFLITAVRSFHLLLFEVELIGLHKHFKLLKGANYIG